MKTKLAWLGAFMLLALTVAANAPTASAAGAPNGEVCYEQVPEFAYHRTVQDFKTQHEIDMYTRTSETPDGSGGWTDWSAPERWTPTGSHLAWVDAVPASEWQHHGSGSGWERQWSEHPTGNTRTVEDGSHTETTGFRTERPYGDGWEQIYSRFVDGEQIPCPMPEIPAPTRTEWVDGEWECDDTTVIQTRTKTNYGWELDEDELTWVATESSHEQVNKRDLTEDEMFSCSTDTTEPDVTIPDTTEPDVTIPDTTEPDVTIPDTTVPPTTPTTPGTPTPPTAPGGLPVTGSATGGLAAIAAALIAIGGMTWFAATRRTL